VTEAPESVLDARAQRLAFGPMHAAMPLETPRQVFKLEHRALAGLACPALVFPNHSCGCYSDGRFVPGCLSAIRRVGLHAAVHHHIPVDGCAPRHACLHFGTRTNRARWRILPMRLLYGRCSVLHLESDPARDQGAWVSWGKLERHRQRARARSKRETGARQRTSRIYGDRRPPIIPHGLGVGC